MNISTLSREGIIQKYLKLEKELNKIKKERSILKSISTKNQATINNWF